MHTHTPAGTGGQRAGGRPDAALADGDAVSGHVAYHEYEGPAFNRGERERLVADLGDKNAMILRNHGLLVCAPDHSAGLQPDLLAGAGLQIQIDILSCNRPLHVPRSRSRRAHADALSGMEITLDNEASTNPHVKTDAQKASSGYGMLEWPALLRTLDRLDRSYRD